ncbi:MAG TPA: hypothetical protein VM074_03400 [Solimonas sp.]|nr:hypothetical protein [Solimonas sp.]
MNHHVLPLAVALLGLGALGPSTAFQIPQADSFRVLDRDVLSWQIAEQGNQALALIRAETRHAVRHLELPALPGNQAQSLPMNSLLVRSE